MPLGWVIVRIDDNLFYAGTENEHAKFGGHPAIFETAEEAERRSQGLRADKEQRPYSFQVKQLKLPGEP